MQIIIQNVEIISILRGGVTLKKLKNLGQSPNRGGGGGGGGSDPNPNFCSEFPFF